MLTQEKLKEFMYYHSDTGDFVFLKSYKYSLEGKRAGYSSDKGYRVVCVDNKAFKSHRLAFLYMTGDWPKGQVDHIDRDTSNNSWENLRDVTQEQNQANTSTRKNNSSRFKGVSWDKDSKSWRVRVMTPSGRKHLGRFSDVLDAAKVYNLAAIMYQGEYAYLNEIPNDC